MNDSPPDPRPEDNPAAAFDPGEPVGAIGGPAVGSGTLPPWFLRAVVGGSALIASGLVLFGITLVVNMLARLVISRSNVQ